MKIMLITGASRGIGAECAKLAAQKGYSVAINYHASADAAETLAHDIIKTGGKAITIRADMADSDAISHMFETCDSELGKLDVLVNNAGIISPSGKLVDMDAARLNRIMAVNIRAPFLCARQAVLRMSTERGGKGGAIVNVSSAASRLGSPNEFIDYAATKGAIDTFTIGLAKEVGPEGIRVNAVRPGIIETEIHAAAGDAERVQRFTPMVPLKRSGSAAETAQAIIWLACDEASYISGTLLDVTGGR